MTQTVQTAARAGLEEDAGAAEQRIRVVLVDDDAMARRVVRDALQEAGFIVIAEAAGGREGVELSLYYKPDVVVMDVGMPGMDGLEATRRIVEAGPDTKVVLLTASDEEAVAFAGLRAGAVGFVSKDIDVAALPRVLDSAHHGQAVVSRALTMRLIEVFRSMRPDGLGMRPIRSPLTSREWEVLDLMCEGQTTERIADALVLSSETVRSHVKSILRKLGVKSRAEAIAATQELRAGMTGVRPQVRADRASGHVASDSR